MIKKLIEIAIHKNKNKRQLGIFLGFKKEFASQSIYHLIKNQNIKYSTLKKLLQAAEMDHLIDASITAEHNRLFKKK